MQSSYPSHVILSTFKLFLEAVEVALSFLQFVLGLFVLQLVFARRGLEKKRERKMVVSTS